MAEQRHLQQITFWRKTILSYYQQKLKPSLKRSDCGGTMRNKSNFSKHRNIANVHARTHS